MPAPTSSILRQPAARHEVRPDDAARRGEAFIAAGVTIRAVTASPRALP